MLLLVICTTLVTVGFAWWLAEQWHVHREGRQAMHETSKYKLAAHRDRLMDLVLDQEICAQCIEPRRIPFVVSLEKD